MTRKHSKAPSTNAEANDTVGVATPEPVPTEREKLELRIGFYGLAEFARRDEISAIEAADLIAIEAHDVANLDGKAKRVPWENNDRNRKNILSLILRRGESEKTMHPLSVWLSRASAKRIRYMAALDEVVLREAQPQFREFEAVQHDESPPESPSDQALEAALKALDSVPDASLSAGHKKKPGPKPKVDDAKKRVQLAAKKFFEVNKEAWNCDLWPAWKVLNTLEVIREVWGVEAKQLRLDDAQDNAEFKAARGVNLREMLNAVNDARSSKPVEN